MRTMEKFEELKELLKKPLFRAAEARKAGVHPSLLSYYAKKGLIERVSRGFYRGKSASLDVDFRFEDLVFTVKSVPRGVVGLISALSVYELTEEVPRVHWIVLPHSTSAPKREKTKFVRMRNTRLGRTELQMNNTTIPVFDRERTIVDAFRYLSKETAIKALKAALKKHGKEKLDLRKLQAYGKKLRVHLEPYVLTATT